MVASMHRRGGHAPSVHDLGHNFIVCAFVFFPSVLDAWEPTTVVHLGVPRGITALEARQLGAGNAGFPGCCRPQPWDACVRNVQHASGVPWSRADGWAVDTNVSDTHTNCPSM